MRPSWYTAQSRAFRTYDAPDTPPEMCGPGEEEPELADEDGPEDLEDRLDRAFREADDDAADAAADARWEQRGER